MNRTAFATLVTLLFTSSLLAGNPYLPGPSWRGEPGTYAVFWQDWPGSSGILGPDAYLAGGGGDGLTLSPYAYSPESNVLASWEGRSNVLHADYISFVLDNYDDPKPYKVVRVQVTYHSSGGVPDEFGVWSTHEGGEVYSQHEAVVVASIESEGWTTAAYEFTLEPNPLNEEIMMGFTWLGSAGASASAYVDEAIVDTWCTDVPEPATLALLTIGALAILRRPKRAG